MREVKGVQRVLLLLPRELRLLDANETEATWRGLLTLAALRMMSPGIRKAAGGEACSMYPIFQGCIGRCRGCKD